MSSHKSANFSDGQAIAPDDLNSISQWMQAQILDTLAGFAKVDPEDQFANLNFLFSVGQGGAPFTGTGLQLKFSQGIIAQQLGSVGGTSAASAWYRLALNEVAASLGAADPTNPRIDLVCVKLTFAIDTPVTRDFETTTGVKSTQTFQSARSTVISSVVVVPGTPGATPTIPTLPATMVPWAAVVVRAGATTLAVEDIYDFRVPLGGCDYVDVAGKDFSFFPTLCETFDSWLANGLAVTGSLAGVASVALKARPYQRVMKIQLTSDGGTSAKLMAGADNHFWGDNTLPLLRDLTASLLGSGMAKRSYTPTVPPSALQPPIWGNGYSNPRVPSIGSPGIGILQVAFAAGVGLTVSNCRFLVAG